MLEVHSHNFQHARPLRHNNTGDRTGSLEQALCELRVCLLQCLTPEVPLPIAKWAQKFLLNSELLTSWYSDTTCCRKANNLQPWDKVSLPLSPLFLDFVLPPMNLKLYCFPQNESAGTPNLDFLKSHTPHILSISSLEGSNLFSNFLLGNQIIVGVPNLMVGMLFGRDFTHPPNGTAVTTFQPHT